MHQNSPIAIYKIFPGEKPPYLRFGNFIAPSKIWLQSCN